MEEKLQEMVDKFNRKVEKDEDLRKNLEGIERRIVIEVTDGETYNLHLMDNKMSPLQKGAVDNPDIVVTTDTATLTGLMDGTVKPMKAYATKKVKFKASVKDMMLLKKLLM